MRIEATTTSISWIPSEAMSGMMRLPLDAGIGHYDQAPPDRVEGLGHLHELRDGDRFRFANHLAAWVEVADGRITAWGHDEAGGGVVGSTTLTLGRAVTVAAVALPEVRPEPEVGDGWVRFTQTAGGRTGVPMPRRVNHPPFVQIWAPTAWTTLELTLHADGRSEHRLAGASPFPRHWVYGPDGALSAKSATIDFKDWYRHAFGAHTPWGDEDSETLATAVESALERELSATIMRGGKKPRIRKVKEGALLTEQGEEGGELYLLLDGVLEVIVDGEVLAELGPGAVVGERALLEGGRRTSTLRARTKSRVAVARGVELDPAAMEELREGHRREEHTREEHARESQAAPS
jgi:hypothetical protein